MALDSTTLQTSIEAAFKKAKATPAPSDPAQAGQVQDQILAQLAQDLAGAIDTFVTGADVVQVVVQVTNTAQQVVGTGTQTAPGKLQ